MLNEEIVLKINLNPTEKHLANIENWLIEEWNKTGIGFYSNWEMIPKAFVEKRLSIITENDFAIGFVVYRISELHSDIDIAEIKPTERKKGIAKKLINETLECFKQKGVLVTRLYCEPENSEQFWKRIGFENYPELIDDTKIHMFKPLVECIKQTEKAKTNSTISLWNCEPNQSIKVNAKWIWDLAFLPDNETLIKPIIFPTASDWTLELVKNGKEILKDKVKYFRMDLADYPSFMIIRKIKT